MQFFSGKIVNKNRYLHKSAKSLISPKEEEIVTLASQCIGKFKWNVARLDLSNLRNVSLMEYQDFTSTAFPALLRSWKVDVETYTFKQLSYSDHNPPILHRKELLIDPELDEYGIYSALTDRLEKLGAFKEMHKYGTRKKWQAHLARLNIVVRHHNVYQV